MRESQGTITNTVIIPEIVYCRAFVRSKHFGSVRPDVFLVSLDISGTQSEIHIEDAAAKYVIEEQLEGALCAFLASEESELKASETYKDFASNLLSLRSSKVYSITRTTPIINKLNKIWVNFVTGLTWLPIDIDSVHRNVVLDITSSDPVEDFLRIEPFGEIAEIQLTIPYVSGPMPKFNKIISSALAQENISFDCAPRAVTLDFEEEE